MPPSRLKIAMWICLSLLTGGWVSYNLAVGLYGLTGVERAADNDPKLTEIATQLVPVMDAADNFRKTNGRYPTSGEMGFLVPRNFSVRTRLGFFMKELAWHYDELQSGSAYTLCIRLGWDPSLFYESSTDSWSSCPGTDPSRHVIRLKIR